MPKLDRQQLAAAAASVRRTGPRFYNLERTPAHGLGDFLRWQWQSRGKFPPGQRFPLRPVDDARLAAPVAPQLTWIGHSTFLFQHRGLNLLTDPVFSERASPFQWLGPRRYTPPALTVAALPPIHQVLISHNHYDHLDHHSVMALHQRFGDALTWFVPTGVAAWFHRRGIRQVRECGWWEGAEQDGAEAFLVPAQHFSGRGVSDGNHSLWGGWIWDCGDLRLYFAGDTGYGGCFAEIGALFPDIDLALIPIGAFEPRWLMQPVHVNPDEAVRIHRDIGARRSVGMHWGTFVLTDEPMDAPPHVLQRALAEQQVPSTDFIVMAHGETLSGPELLSSRVE
ncbi:MBL fold metallo-hydrolase [Isoalcanivorax beigongshangi]|uniref:MBL fold metallo-hydrolase n=1 Tax=Isoalcanivorax beigongshangi TaxID=3238810 RepID=A0ABV4AG67_9GAMM